MGGDADNGVVSKDGNTTPAPLIGDAAEDAFADELGAVIAGRQPSAILPLLPASALTTALVDGDGLIVWAQERFALLLDADANDLNAAMQAAGKRDVALSHARAKDGRAICLVLATPEAAARWPLVAPGQDLKRAAGARVAVIVALADQTEALNNATRAFGFTPLESRICVALVQCGTLPDAARRCDIAYETAREAIESARRKAGVARQAALVARLTSIAAQVGDDDAEATRVLVDTFALSPREAKLAVYLMRTGSRQDAARAANVSAAVAKKTFTRIFEALGAKSASDVSSTVLEAIAAALLAGAANLELPPALHPREPLRLIPRGDGGMIAISDYGPPAGRPLLVTHSGSATRLVPRSLVKRLQAEGWRPIAIDRPGFGLTSLRADTDNPWHAAAADMNDALDALGIARIDILVRGGVYAVAALARAEPARVGCIVAMNPDVSSSESQKRAGAIGLLWRAGENNPGGYDAIVRWLATRTTPRRLVSLQKVLLRRSPIDLAALQDPSEQEDLRRSVGHFAAGRLEGAIREHYEHSRGAICAPLDDGSHWRVLMGAEDPMHDAQDMEAYWRARLPGAHFEIIEGGGRFLHLTHPERVSSALSDASSR
ncbi:alpha/beta fold hydrolase [Terricaulis sp.]|uniref:alpha/beta fold hydrolase n=1 Tax=Terricaulis sp. TaxID=2768686 RepID=UPI002AC530D3|nr:alpha/beta fold hydrolase [Terricaulis sp.]MDZ4690274.1 alpha/beta fold hydrolase [Terricaulis sp.]